MTQQSHRNKKLLTHMNGAWEALTLSQNSESILKTGDGILVWLIELLNRFVTLQKHKASNLVSITTIFQKKLLTANGRTGSCLTTP